MSDHHQADDFAALVAAADGALVVVTATADGERDGCLVGFHSQASIDPLRYAVWLSKANRTYRLARVASHLAVHFLTVDDADVAEHFATTTGDTVDKFAGWAWTPGPGGVALLDRLGNRIVGRRRTVMDDGGDHVAVVVEPEAVTFTGEFSPLRLAAARHWRPGHPA